MINAVAITAPSGTGKATISSILLLLAPELYVLVDSATTRKPKEEKHGKKYHHVSYEEFEGLIAEGKLLEYNKYESDSPRGYHYYGSLRSSYEAIISLGKIGLLDIDINGLLHLRRMLGDSLLSFGLECEPEEILSRLTNRNSENQSQIAVRWKTGKEELKRMPLLKDQGVIDELVWYGKGEIPDVTGNKIHNIVHSHLRMNDRILNGMF